MGVAAQGPAPDDPSLLLGEGRLRPLPQPLAGLILAMDGALAALADEGGGRDDLHALRNHLSDLCVLTEETPPIRRAVDRLAAAGDRLGEAAVALRGYERRWRRPRLGKARRALASLERVLAGARPSRIAVRLDRDW
ncbi:hypothetical protein [Methylorubrum zatmanii]|uniref:CHAD domain-containing protein n=1 Tax=Methylorubrum zatmanii TaxID=29429 RepID=A0ABW1WRK3_9HYPH|nr:hypothetical protein [Methylorubrum zatmanii]MBD8905356.1 hypothetical protein [Methylorubrum zatmanii]